MSFDDTSTSSTTTSLGADATTAERSDRDGESVARSRSSRLTRLVVGGTIAVATIGAGAGIAAAQTADADGSNGDGPALMESGRFAGGAPDEVREHVAERRQERIESLAEFLGTTSEEIREDLSEGMTLAQIAEANGVSSSDLEAELSSRIEARILEGLESGRLSESEAERRLEHLDAVVSSAVDTTLEERRSFVADRMERRIDRLQERLDRLQSEGD